MNIQFQNVTLMIELRVYTSYLHEKWLERQTKKLQKKGTREQDEKRAKLSLESICQGRAPRLKGLIEYNFFCSFSFSLSHRFNALFASPLIFERTRDSFAVYVCIL